MGKSLGGPQNPCGLHGEQKYPAFTETRTSVPRQSKLYPVSILTPLSLLYTQKGRCSFEDLEEDRG
jgi:hypothetical protein